MHRQGKEDIKRESPQASGSAQESERLVDITGGVQLPGHSMGCSWGGTHKRTEVIADRKGEYQGSSKKRQGTKDFGAWRRTARQACH